MRYCFLRFPQGKMKALTLSYDDAPKEDIKMAQILDRYGIKCTFNLSNWIAPNTVHLTKEEIQTHLLDKGHEIAVHGADHIAPGAADPCRFIADVLDCRKNLEDMYGLIIRGMAYPDTGITKMHGYNNYETIRTNLKSMGIAYARSLGGDNNLFMSPSDFHAWMPTIRHKNPELMEYVRKFLSINETNVISSHRYARLFYMWGHSFEFEHDNNWELLEEFCEAVSGKDDIWYATNIEIYDYVTAWYSMITSADGKQVYNPTLVDLWMDVDGVLYSVPSGATIRIEE